MNMFNYITSQKNLYTPSVSKIYLCVKLRDKMEYFYLNYNCIKFDTYEEADKYYKKSFEDKTIESSTMMPVCKYVPEYFHPMILNYKLSKLFIDAHIINK